MSVDRSLNIRVDEYAVEEIAPKIYKINEYNLTTMFIIVGTERALLIDCGTGVGDYKSVAEKLVEGKPYDLAVTHAHCDHIGGRGQFDTMYISEADVPIIKDVTVFFRKFYIAVMKYLMFFKVIRWRDAKVEKVKKEPELKFLKEGDTFELGDRTIRVYETKGHTRGCLSYLVEQDRILFTGDNVNPQTLMFLKWATTTEELKTTLQRIKRLGNYDTIWSSHLSAPTPPETLERAVDTTEKIVAHGNGLPFLHFTSNEDYVIINWGHKRRIRRNHDK